MNNKLIKEMFERELDSEKMKKKVLLSYEMKRENKFRVLKYVVPACVFVLLCGVLFLNSNSLFRDDKKQEYYDDIVINKIGELGAYRIDADIKVLPSNGFNIPWLDFLKDGIELPKDLNKVDVYSIYTRKDKVSSYDIFNSYVYDYYKDDGLRNIRIAFSSDNRPIRDYYFSEEGSVKSLINDCELVIYRYEEVYFTNFKYKDYYFDIETSNVSIDELSLLLKSIIK